MGLVAVTDAPDHLIDRLSADLVRVYVNDTGNRVDSTQGGSLRRCTDDIDVESLRHSFLATKRLEWACQQFSVQEEAGTLRLLADQTPKVGPQNIAVQTWENAAIVNSSVAAHNMDLTPALVRFDPEHVVHAT